MKVGGLGFARPMSVSESNGSVLPASHTKMEGWLTSDFDKNILQCHLLGAKEKLSRVQGFSRTCIVSILILTSTQPG